MLPRKTFWTAFAATLLFCASILRADIVSHDGTIATSVLRLLAHPEKYAGKRVQVRGYYVSGLELSGLSW